MEKQDSQEPERKWPLYLTWSFLIKGRFNLLHINCSEYICGSSHGGPILNIYYNEETSAHLTQRVMWTIVTTERPSSVVRPTVRLSVRPLTFHILINSSEATGPIWNKLWWNGPWMAPFQNCVRWSRFPINMAVKQDIEKRGDGILFVHCCFSIGQNELKF
jgi:hypothetical protein